MTIVPYIAAGSAAELAKPIIGAAMDYGKKAAKATATKLWNFAARNKGRAYGYISKASNTAAHIGKRALWTAKSALKGTLASGKWAWGQTAGRLWADDQKEHTKKVNRELADAKDEIMKEHKEMGTIVDAAGKDIIADRINKFYGIDVTSSNDMIRQESQKIDTLNKYAGGTQLQKTIENIKKINSDPSKTWKDIDWNTASGGAAELIGRLTQDDPDSRWTPMVSAGIGAAKKFLGVTNPLLGVAMDVGGLLATTPVARKAAAMVGKGIAAVGKGAWKLTKKLFKGKDPALQHSEDVIPIYQEPEYDDPPVQKPIDYSGINIPNLLPQESNAEYMMRMTGGMNVGPANANVVSYSGYRKPQYEKTANRVMMAPPRAATKRVKVRRRKA